MLRNHEFVIRLLAMLGNGLNAFLLGWLVYRWLGSKLAAVTSGSLFLLPFYAHEAVLWASAYGRILGTCLSLLTLYAFNSAVGSQSKSGTWIVLGSITFLLTLLTAEFYTSIIIFIPLLALIAAKDTSSWFAHYSRACCVAFGVSFLRSAQGVAAVPEHPNSGFNRQPEVNSLVRSRDGRPQPARDSSSTIGKRSDDLFGRTQRCQRCQVPFFGIFGRAFHFFFLHVGANPCDDLRRFITPMLPVRFHFGYV